MGKTGVIFAAFEEAREVNYFHKLMKKNYSNMNKRDV